MQRWAGKLTKLHVSGTGAALNRRRSEGIYLKIVV